MVANNSSASNSSTHQQPQLLDLTSLPTTTAGASIQSTTTAQLIEPPVVVITRDMFGAKHGKIHQEELRPFIVNVTLFALSRLPQFRALTESPLGDLMSSVVAGQVFRGIFSAIVQANEDCFYQAQSIVDLVAERLNSVLDSCLREKNRYISQAKCYTGAAAHMSVAGKRNTNEDRHVAFPFLNEMLALEKPRNSLAFYGVFDGHGGSECADFVATRLHLNIANNPLIISDPKRAVLEGYIQTHQQWKWSARRCGYSESTGSTAVTVLVQDRSLYIAWAGDSAAMIFLKNGTCLEFVTPHKPQYEMEKKRIIKLGGNVKNDRVNGILAVSRSFGDTAYGCVNPEPNIMEYTLRGDERFLLLACDGLTDVMSSTQILEVINSVIGDPTNERKIGAVSQALINKALEKDTADNVSVVFIPLDVPHRFKEPENIQFTDLQDLCTKSLITKPISTDNNYSSGGGGVTSLVQDFSRTSRGVESFDQPFPTLQNAREEIESLARAIAASDEFIPLADERSGTDLASKVRQRLQSEQFESPSGGSGQPIAIANSGPAAHDDDPAFAADCPTPPAPEPQELATEEIASISFSDDQSVNTNSTEPPCNGLPVDKLQPQLPPTLSIISNRDILDAMVTNNNNNNNNFTWKQALPSPISPGPSISTVPRSQLSPLIEGGTSSNGIPSLVATRSPLAVTTSGSPPASSPTGTLNNRKLESTSNTIAIQELQALLEINRQISTGSPSPSVASTPYSTQAIQELRNQFRLANLESK